jgi:phage tail tape-measure protein
MARSKMKKPAQRKQKRASNMTAALAGFVMRPQAELKSARAGS